jgi:hypothetical protein
MSRISPSAPFIKEVNMGLLVIVFSVLVALGFHIFIGWQYSVVGAILAGALVKSRPVLAGVSTLVLCWGGMIIYNFWVAGPESIEMIRVIAVLIGDMPPILTVTLTIGIAALLGMLGGWLGAVPINKVRKSK